MAAADFEIIGQGRHGEPVIPPIALLGAVPEPVAERARFWESHILEVLTGLPGDAAEGAVPRPEFDPRLHGLAEREAAKAAELAAAGEPGSVRTLCRCGSSMRGRGCGAWSITGPPGWARSSGGSTRESSTRSRRQWESRPTTPPEPGSGPGGGRKRSSPRVTRVRRCRCRPRQAFTGCSPRWKEGRHAFGSAVRRRSNANRPATPFTVTHRAAARGDRPGRHHAAGCDGGL